MTGVDWVSPLGLAARGVDFDIGAVSLDVKALLVLKEVGPGSLLIVYRCTQKYSPRPPP
jgi:hypothetical protein